ncbi:MAG TPA: CGNR zinc finger domain-containing protein [Pseudonocardia sp.]|nr:CGNR zinc finger domain-containing protein [Pseudonocardia sp.]
MARIRNAERPHFPLLGEPLPLDLINTELSVAGQRVDLLCSTRWWREWLNYQRHRIEPMLHGPITESMRRAATLGHVRVLRTAAAMVVNAARAGEHITAHSTGGPTIFPAALRTPTKPASGEVLRWPNTGPDKAYGDAPWPGSSDAEALYDVLATAIVDLSRSPRVVDIRECAAPDCDQLFLPAAPSRQWCVRPFGAGIRALVSWAPVPAGWGLTPLGGGC